MRLAGRQRLGFYPLPIAEAKRIRTFLHFPEQVCLALDPCIGEGVAFAEVTRDAKTHRCEIELDAQRAALARSLADDVIHGNCFDVQCPVESFSLIYLNPPYDFEIGEDKSQRMERLFLEHVYRWLKRGGVLILVIPRAYIRDCGQILAYQFRDVRVYHLTEAVPSTDGRDHGYCEAMESSPRRSGYRRVRDRQNAHLIGAVHVHSERKPFTALTMVPPQLVEKWARETFLTMPRVRVFFIDGLRSPTSSVGHAGVNEVRLRHGRTVREGLRTTLTELQLRKTARTARQRWESICGFPALFIVGRERGKLSYFWRHVYGHARCGRYQGSVVNSDTGCPIYLGEDGERLLSADFTS